jgi:glycosyltransferase involved in cell wall biosynthesis
MPPPVPADRESPRVSVIIPNYNHARYVGDAIRSVLAQSYRSHEIIVVDDGSTDDSRDVITAFGDQVRYLPQENSGLSAARNAGIMASTGALLGVLDADDMYEPDYLSTLVPALQAAPDAAGIYCGYRFVDEANRPLPQIECREVAPDRLFGALLDGNFLVPESILLRRRCYDEVGLFDEALRSCEDWDVWLRVTRAHRILHSGRILTRHRVLPHSMSANPDRMLSHRLAVLRKHVGPEPADALSIGGAVEGDIGRRAYGRAHLAGCVEYLQVGDQARALHCFRRMAAVFPDLLVETDTFYQLGCGDQPKGWMGDLSSVHVSRNGETLHGMLDAVFDDPEMGSRVRPHRRQAYATAAVTMGMLAYGARQCGEARRWLSRAMRTDPTLLWRPRWATLWMKSLLGARMLDWISPRTTGRRHSS